MLSSKHVLDLKINAENMFHFHREQGCIFPFSGWVKKLLPMCNKDCPQVNEYQFFAISFCGFYNEGMNERTRKLLTRGKGDC